VATAGDFFPMNSMPLYEIDGLLILGVVLVCVTVFSAVRGLHARSLPAARVSTIPHPPKLKLKRRSSSSSSDLPTHSNRAA
jgi:hypothetical protein